MPDNGLPSGWRWARLGDVADTRRDLFDPRNASSLPYVALENIGQGVPRLIDYGESSASVSMKTRFKTGDVLFGKLRPHLRKAVRVPFDGVCSTDILALFTKDGLQSEYLAQLTYASSLQDFAISTSIGTKMPRTSWPALSAYRLPLPPPDEQRRIAEVLDAIDAAIEKTETVIAATERLRSALLGELLTRGVPGWHTEWKQAPGIGTIPACWEVVRLGDVADVKNGTTPSKSRSDYWAEDGTPFIRTGQVNDVVIREAEQFLTPAGVAAGAVIIPRGSVLIAMIGQGKTRGMAARLDIDGAVNQNFAAVVAKPRLTGDFFFAWAGQHYDEIRGLGQGSNQGALNCGLVGSIRLPLPPKAEQQVIVALNAALADRLTGEQSALDGIIEAKSMAAAALLSGRVRVS